ncbi:hypothetical protein [Chamaesiphon sp. OTE_75_metabat_556]|uniref:hypothetical protein n=1 Tax=Chamaesiphon sp. OTE_75_metabat_556 TaxID=2964692 RepID=UPI00286CA968|nr:hypothetical protein [Chamaesiphon sp. OTE_75_metabat_556]
MASYQLSTIDYQRSTNRSPLWIVSSRIVSMGKSLLFLDRYYPNSQLYPDRDAQ